MDGLTMVKVRSVQGVRRAKVWCRYDVAMV